MTNGGDSCAISETGASWPMIRSGPVSSGSAGCGFSEERAKAALTKAIKMGLLKGGPLLS